MTDVPGLDCAGLTRWLAREHPHLAPDAAEPLTAQVIAGGRSNLTYRVDGARRPLVLRRPPLGHVLSSAHDMHREHRVISALGASAVPVPAVVDVVDDADAREVTGTTFFVMERVAGTVLARPEQNAAYTADGLHRLGTTLATTLADLHAVSPDDVGLADFGRPAGYLGRQLATWRRQYDASRSRDLPEVDELQDRLGASMPTTARTGIVHGDYRLDNALVAGTPDHPTVAAVLDWEMATLGDPLVDLGLLGLYWDIRTLTPSDTVVSAVVPDAGYPTFDEVVDTYAARSGTSVPDLWWYRAFAAYKLAVILEGIHFRYRAGETVGDGFDAIGDLVAPLATDGLARAAARPRSA